MLQQNKISKDRAIALRLQGKSYKEISQELSCSVDWCKRNLKGIKKQDISEQDYLGLLHKGRSFDCCTKPEILDKIQVPLTQTGKEHNKELMKATNRVKRKLQKEEDVIVRQAWVHPARARYSYNNMLSYINMLNEVLDEYVTQHLRECGFEDDSNYNSVLAFMVMNSQFGQRVLRNYSAGVFEAIDKTVDEIEERNGAMQGVELSPVQCTFKLDELPY